MKPAPVTSTTVIAASTTATAASSTATAASITANNPTSHLHALIEPRTGVTPNIIIINHRHLHDIVHQHGDNASDDVINNIKPAQTPTYSFITNIIMHNHSHQRCPALSWRIPSATRIRHAFSALSIPSQCFCKAVSLPHSTARNSPSQTPPQLRSTRKPMFGVHLTHLNEQLCPGTFLPQTLLANSVHQSSIGLANPLLRNCLPQLRQHSRSRATPCRQVCRRTRLPQRPPFIPLQQVPSNR